MPDTVAPDEIPLGATPLGAHPLGDPPPDDAAPDRPPVDCPPKDPRPADAVGSDLRFTLFIAGRAPSSIAARGSLTRVLASLDLPPDCVVVIDVLDDPAAALAAGLLATPTLMARHIGAKDGGVPQTFIGDLRQPDRLLAWLEGIVGRMPGWRGMGE